MSGFERQKGRPGRAFDQTPPHVLIGITSHQTCLVLPARIRVLKDAGFRVSLVSGPGEMLEETARTEGVKAYTVRMGRGISLLRDVVAFLRLWRLMIRLKPDIVEFSTPKAGLLGSFAAWLCRVPMRVYFLRGLRLETAHGLRRRVLLWSERIAAGCAQVVLCNSHSLRERALVLGIAQSSKVVLLGAGSSNGVDVVRFRPGQDEIRERFKIPSNATVVGFAGRLTADKGLPELLEAFAGILHERPDAYLLLVGWFDAAEDALERNVRTRVEGHPRIVLTGFVADTAPYYRAMDIMVLPSWREGFPNAVLEAAASGVPVVATDCTGSRDAVVHEVTGLLVPTGRPDAIRDGCLRLMRNPERRQRMAQAARNWVVENFEDRRVLGLAVELYRQLVSRARTEAGSYESAAEPATGLPASL
jgi:glycosyltransferase involved in cell wall biosynthesis